ncbi:Aste57867_11267 [Aphanomyces stellatus]|uniref:Aste57867_11267 protein n=1 Tax=Aphanomyces stellatus TaxID=120398 RepID=A0A485KSL6_9STRA|nr:hypothetical protein As57867_011225 [Aphanomyces stellatus]VFT88130.1 Aste57867_11267 [Aphanomyces stellatus]
MTAAMPYIQTGFKLLKGLNTVAGILKTLGVPSLSQDVMTKAATAIDQATKMSSVFDFDILQSAVEAADKSAPVEHIRGASLRQLVRFYDKFDPTSDFSGLERVWGPNGQAMWTTETTAQPYQKPKSGQPHVVDTSVAPTAQQIYLQMLAEKPVVELKIAEPDNHLKLTMSSHATQIEVALPTAVLNGQTEIASARHQNFAKVLPECDSGDSVSPNFGLAEVGQPKNVPTVKPADVQSINLPTCSAVVTILT